MSASHGGILMALPATEPRYGAVIFVGDGVGKWDLRGDKAVSGIDFAPLIRVPKLQVHGIYDESTPLETQAKPLYNLLTGEKDKKYFDCAHRVEPKDLVPTVNDWLEKTFGRVQSVASE
jgi:hypothetical protein